MARRAAARHRHDRRHRAEDHRPATTSHRRGRPSAPRRDHQHVHPSAHRHADRCAHPNTPQPAPSDPSNAASTRRSSHRSVPSTHRTGHRHPWTAHGATHRIARPDAHRSVRTSRAPDPRHGLPGPPGAHPRHADDRAHRNQGDRPDARPQHANRWTCDARSRRTDDGLHRPRPAHANRCARHPTRTGRTDRHELHCVHRRRARLPHGGRLAAATDRRQHRAGRRPAGRNHHRSHPARRRRRTHDAPLHRRTRRAPLLRRPLPATARRRTHPANPPWRNRGSHRSTRQPASRRWGSHHANHRPSTHRASSHQSPRDSDGPIPPSVRRRGPDRGRPSCARHRPRTRRSDQVARRTPAIPVARRREEHRRTGDPTTTSREPLGRRPRDARGRRPKGSSPPTTRGSHRPAGRRTRRTSSRTARPSRSPDLDVTVLDARAERTGDRCSCVALSSSQTTAPWSHPGWRRIPSAP